MLTAQREAVAARGTIRFFMTDRASSDTPLDDVPRAWVVAAAENGGKYSAEAWNFSVAPLRALKPRPSAWLFRPSAAHRWRRGFRARRSTPPGRVRPSGLGITTPSRVIRLR